MNKNKELAKNTIIIIIGKLCTQFISFLLIPLYTAYLATDDFGVVDLLNTYILLLVPVITLQLESAVFRFLIDARENEDKKANIINNIFKYVFIQILIFVLIYIVLVNFIKIPYKYLLVSNIVACILSSIVLQIARGLGNNKVYSVGSVISGSVSVILNVVLIAVFRIGAFGILISNIVANLMCFVYILAKLNIFKYIKLRKTTSEDKKIVKDMYKYSLPMIPNAISWWIVKASDRTIISFMINASANGIYAIANKFSSIYIAIYNLFNLSWTESAAMHRNDNDRKIFFTDIINRMFNLFSSICILIIAFLPLVFSIIVKANFQEAYNYIPILMIASLFNVVVGLYSVIYVAEKKTKQIAKTSLGAAVINVIVNLLLVKRIGLYAAAVSTAVSYLVMMIYRYFDVKKYLDIKLSKLNIFLVIIMVIIATIAYYINNIFVSLFAGTITCIYAIYINKSIILDTINLCKEKIKLLQKKGRIQNED